jgi:preprotein translocase subunit SecG
MGEGSEKRVKNPELEERTRVRRQESEEGASSPFYSESGTPGFCQVTVGQSLDKMPILINVIFFILFFIIRYFPHLHFQ